MGKIRACKQRYSEKNYLAEVEKIVKEIEYGSITIVIQDGRIIQINKNEKVKF
ncbi:MAG: YezD family protein [Butyrivibrio sp.]|nr:YezD family protein [Butyrivibrio sp.]